MTNNYLNTVESDAALYAIVQDKIPDLQRLSPIQIEKLVFYLKSLHTYYQQSENTDVYSEFEAKLEKLRNSSEQLILQRLVASNIVKAIGSSTFAGLLLGGALFASIAGRIGIAVGCVVISIALIAFADGKWLKRAVVIAKEQDRKYFLSSIRTARGCNELDWSGLFSYNTASIPGPESCDDLAHMNGKVGRLTAKLRAALYNDEFFRYSSSELDVSNQTDSQNSN